MSEMPGVHPSVRKVYVGCGLTHAPQAFRRSVACFKNLLREHCGVEVLEFLDLEAGTPRDVYQRDIVEGVGGCDWLLAVCDYASTGLGLEIGAALWRYRKPVLAVAQENCRVSRLMFGIVHPLYFFRRYEYWPDICRIFAETTMSAVPSTAVR